MWLVRSEDLDLKLRDPAYNSAATPIPREDSAVTGETLESLQGNSEQKLL